MIKEKAYIKLEVETTQNLAYRKTKGEWSQPYQDKHTITIENTPENRKFVSMLSRLCSNEEYIKALGFTTPMSPHE